MFRKPARNWVDLGEWGKGMDGFKLPSSDDLAGRTITLMFNGSRKVTRCLFRDSGFLDWDTGSGRKKRFTQNEPYEAIRIDPGIYFVDFLKWKNSAASQSLVLDLNTRGATVLTAALPGKQKATSSLLNRLGQGVDLSSIQVEIQHALINPLSPDETIPVHERTSELIGKRIQYTYSPDHVYEHVYLNDRFYTWHCLKGAEAGLADTEVCDYFKIAPDIYLFSWREKIMPTFGLVLINLKTLRSNGKTFGLDLKTGERMNFTMGAIAELVSILSPP
jgi:hypothetical protein